MNRRDDNFFPQKRRRTYLCWYLLCVQILTRNLPRLLELQLCSTFNPDLQWTEQVRFPNWNHFSGILASEVWIFFCKNNFDFLSPAGSPAWPRGDRQAGQQAALPQCYRWQYSQPSFYFDFINTSISDLDELHLSYLQFFPSYQHRDKARSITWAKNKSIRAPSFISTFRLLSLITEIGSWSQVKQRKKQKAPRYLGSINQNVIVFTI